MLSSELTPDLAPPSPPRRRKAAGLARVEDTKMQISKAEHTMQRCQKLESTGGNGDSIAWDAAVIVEDGEFGYGPCKVYRMSDGSTLSYDGRGWTVSVDS